MAMNLNVSEEIERLKEEITRLGKPCPDGSISVKFGTLFNDERCANIFEALVGTLRAARKRKLVKFDSEILLQGVHDNPSVHINKVRGRSADDGRRNNPSISCTASTQVSGCTLPHPMRCHENGAHL
ncbi:hypothetical protein R1sor_024015 [Riccia sorocarpa]|uniref:Costars domain-containing protein n=1 Tax=Riccia sorocarpa TaxID=122646 RepID=A0ABD3GRM3_9MARC